MEVDLNKYYRCNIEKEVLKEFSKKRSKLTFICIFTRSTKYLN
tara:strand:+ start:841 stop:969 length:129 start_codon:yes stop_codon:yes gene_type:complete